MTGYDFIVVGAGIAGASIACELAAEARVLLLEQEEQPGYHATGRSAAILSELYGAPIVRDLTSASWPCFEAPPTGFTDYPLLRPRGALYVASGDLVAELDRLDGDVSPGLREKPRRLDAARARELVPVLRSNWAEEALFEPGAADIDVGALLQGYLRGFRERGGTLQVGSRVEVIEQGPAGWTAFTSHGTFVAPVLVNAAGPWAADIAERANVLSFGLTALRRTALLVDAKPLDGLDAWPFTIGMDESLYFKPDAGKLLVSPGDETPSEPGDAQPEEWDVAVAVDRLERFTCLSVSRVSHRWAGLRTVAPDRLPVVGFDPTASGFFWLAGQGGSGVQTAPALAQVGAALARGRTPPPQILDHGVDANLISPVRFRAKPLFQPAGDICDRHDA